MVNWMNYYRIDLTNNNIDDFLYVCNKLDFIIVSIMCTKRGYFAVYKGRYKITDLQEMYMMVMEGE
jgi:hypothetical protein